MKKIIKIILILVFVFIVISAGIYIVGSNNKSPITFDVDKPFKGSIEEKAVATGKVIPKDEVAIKPQITGIIDEIFVKEGDVIKAGDLIAKIKVVPDVSSLTASKNNIASNQTNLQTAEINFKTQKVIWERQKELFEKGVIAANDFDQVNNTYLQAKQQVEQARISLTQSRQNYDIIKTGTTAGLGNIAQTQVRATVSGTILEIPVKEGDQVIQSNNFNDGTSIATIANLNKMIFEGKVDEAEVGKLKIDMPLKVSLGAIQDKEFDAKLKFVAPKGNEEQGAVQFKIEGEVELDDSYFIRAGYSANAAIVLQNKKDILVIKEALLQFDRESQEPFVEVKIGDQKFERRNLDIGLSDGVNVEVLSGVTEKDEIKVWNKTEPIKIKTETK